MSSAEPKPYTLSVRAMRNADWEQAYWMREQASVRYNTLAVPFANPDMFRERTAQADENMHRLIAEATYSDGATIIAGILGFYRGRLSESHSGSFGIQVHQDFQGQGVGSALMAAMCHLADNWLNLHRIELEVFTDNPAGMALYKKFGFEIEATMSRYAFRDGAYTDAYVMGRINPHHLPGGQP